jgi:medium-chain acyl-CoA synthetase
MAHFESGNLTKPEYFNFAQDVVDYWASKPTDHQAMLWVSEDLKEQRSLSYNHFSKQSHRIGLLFEQLDIRAEDVVLMILPRIPEWRVYASPFYAESVDDISGGRLQLQLCVLGL